MDSITVRIFSDMTPFKVKSYPPNKIAILLFHCIRVNEKGRGGKGPVPHFSNAFAIRATERRARFVFDF